MEKRNYCGERVNNKETLLSVQLHDKLNLGKQKMNFATIAIIKVVGIFRSNPTEKS